MELTGVEPVSRGVIFLTATAHCLKLWAGSGADDRGRTHMSVVSFFNEKHLTVYGEVGLVPMTGVEPVRESLPTGF